MADIALILGGIQFQDFEVPERIMRLGGRQMLAVQRLVGGDRVIDAMGRDDADPSWAGRFRGEDAVSRARAIDALRVAGAPISLTFGDFLYTVVVEEFLYDFERFYEVPYSISLVVISDDAPAADTPDTDEMVRSDNTQAQGLAAKFGSALSGVMGTLDAAISAVSNFATASQAVLQTVLGPIAAVRAQVTLLIASAENTMNYVLDLGGAVSGGLASYNGFIPTYAAPTIGGVPVTLAALPASLQAAAISITTVGGVLPGADPDDNVGILQGQVWAASQLSDLYDLDNTLGRMTTNIQAIGASGYWVTLAGGDLYRLARDAYGDASEWATIARVNGISDPVLTGVTSVLVPPTPGGTGGVLTDLREPLDAVVNPYASTPQPAPSGTMLDFSDPNNSGLLTII